MRAQAIELFLDIGLGGEQQGFLVQPLGIEAGARLDEPRDLLAQALHDAPRAAAPTALAARSTRLAIWSSCLVDDGLKPRALRRRARATSWSSAAPRPLEQRCLELGLRLLALLPFHHLDHAAHAEQRIEARQLQVRSALARASAAACAWRSAASFRLMASCPVSRA